MAASESRLREWLWMWMWLWRWAQRARTHPPGCRNQEVRGGSVPGAPKPAAQCRQGIRVNNQSRCPQGHQQRACAHSLPPVAQRDLAWPTASQRTCRWGPTLSTCKGYQAWTPQRCHHTHAHARTASTASHLPLRLQLACACACTCLQDLVHRLEVGVHQLRARQRRLSLRCQLGAPPLPRSHDGLGHRSIVPRVQPPQPAHSTAWHSAVITEGTTRQQAAAPCRLTTTGCKPGPAASSSGTAAASRSARAPNSPLRWTRWTHRHRHAGRCNPAAVGFCIRSSASPSLPQKHGQSLGALGNRAT